MLVRALFLALLLGVPATSRSAEMPPLDGGDRSVGLAAAMDDLRAGRWMAALEAGARSGPVGRDVVEWLRLREGLGDWLAARDFFARNGDWPGLALLRQRTEKFLPLTIRDAASAEAVIDFFAGDDPTTGHGVVALVEAYRALGREGDATAQVALAWVTLSMTAGVERFLLFDYARALAPLEDARMDRMFWAGADGALERAVARGSGDAATLGRARLAARRRGVTDALLAGLPERLRDDPGLAHICFDASLDGNRFGSAETLIREHSVAAAALGAPEAWAGGRERLARRLMLEGDAETAYAIASSHWLTGGTEFAELEWLSGYLALRHLDQPETAIGHFRRLRSAVSSAISLGRAGYWLGRAYAAAGDDGDAEAAFRFAASYQSSFYGLLAAERIGAPLDPALAGRAAYPAFGATAFGETSILEAALLLQAAGERDLAESFFVHLAETLDAARAGTLSDLALDLGEPHLALKIAKTVARRGITLPRAYFPVIGLGVADMPVEPALALAIARRESEFDPGVASGVGARGLMQLMPGTAREVARSLGLPYSATRLFVDPSYNATLGTAYLAGLVEQFGGSPVLVAAGYNAGPGRPVSWIAENGDPRAADVDVVDWIERIPFDETRNYVMRVAESLPIYRARLTGRTGPVDFTAELKGR